MLDLDETPPKEWFELIDKNIILKFLENLANQNKTPPNEWLELIDKNIILQFLDWFADQIPNLQQNNSNLINDWLNLIDSDLSNYLNHNTNNKDEWPNIIKKYTGLYRNALQLLCFDKNLKLEPHIINSFYNALKTKGFVILAGLSGTGKTKIFENFVKCFPEIDPNSKTKNHLFFSIRPDYKDSKSLLGFYNPLTQKYHSTPLLDFILEASKNYLEEGKDADPFFVLFDEMNLARVEYYFADFLSVLEAKRFENANECINNKEFDGFIKNLYSDKNLNVNQKINDKNYKFTSQSIKIHNENIDNIPQEIFLPPNLYFVGTVNIDETTHMFSPKVLDRAFTIEFDVGSFENYVNEFINKQNNINQADQDLQNIIVSKKDNLIKTIKKDFTNKGEFATINIEKISQFLSTQSTQSNQSNQSDQYYVKKLDEINEILKKYNLYFGYRVFNEIIMFLYNCENSIFCKCDKDEAFDLAIKMKILPKFHGTRQKLENPIIELIDNLKKESNLEQKIDDLKNNIEKNGIPKIDELKDFKYKHTLHKLLELLYKLKTQGFTSFI